MINNLFIDIACKQINCNRERICGDTFVSKSIAGGRRTVAVLSDGMGHGVKANILSTLTSTMLLNFISTNQYTTKITETILQALPVCNQRKVSYSTFTIVDIDNLTNEITVIEYDNPACIILRNNIALSLERESTTINHPQDRKLTIYTTRFVAEEGDRLIVVSDGVTQSGQLDRKYKFGWGEDNVGQMVDYLVHTNSNISSTDLAAQLISRACHNDQGRPSDDMSCMSIYMRKRRSLLLVSCPPMLTEGNAKLATIASEFKGMKVICGYLVAEILSKELNIKPDIEDFSDDPTLPPAWSMSGFELVTEGIVTLNRVLDTLELIEDISMVSGHGVSDKLCRLLLRNDTINFVLGGKHKINNVTYMHDEYELRRNILKRIAKLLEVKFGRNISIVTI